MKKGIADLFKRFTSRKFLLALGAGVTFYANGQYTELAATVIAYLAAEGGSDVVDRYATNKYAVPAQIDQKTNLIQSGDLELDTPPKSIVPGL